MGTNWTAVAKKVYQALKKDGMPIVITVTEQTREYDIDSGKRESYPENFDSHGMTKDIETTQGITDPEVCEMIFHTGKDPDEMPDLASKDRLTITAAGIIYKVLKLKPVRPAGITLMYKATVKESANED